MENASFGELVLKELPEESVVYSPQPIDWTMSMEELYSTCGGFLKELGVKSTAAHGAVFKKERFLNGDDSRSECLFCRLDGPNAVKKPAGLYAIIYYQGTYDQMDATYAFLIEELAARNLIMDSNVYEEYLLHSLATLDEAEYITKISVKVKKADM